MCLKRPWGSWAPERRGPKPSKTALRREKKRVRTGLAQMAARLGAVEVERRWAVLTRASALCGGENTDACSLVVNSHRYGDEVVAQMVAVIEQKQAALVARSAGRAARCAGDARDAALCAAGLAGKMAACAAEYAAKQREGLRAQAALDASLVLAAATLRDVRLVATAIGWAAAGRGTRVGPAVVLTAVVALGGDEAAVEAATAAGEASTTTAAVARTVVQEAAAAARAAQAARELADSAGRTAGGPGAVLGFPGRPPGVPVRGVPGRPPGRSTGWLAG